MSLTVRLRQFWWNITAEPLPEPVQQEINDALSPAERELFGRFEASDQWHAYRVFRSLKEKDQNQPELLTAALLHDVGKTKMDLSVWDRTIIVIADRLMPQKATGWGQGDPQSWKRPFVVRSCHAQWGAEMAKTAGSSEDAVNLIRRHQDPLPLGQHSTEYEMLRLLQWADDLN